MIILRRSILSLLWLFSISLLSGQQYLMETQNFSVEDGLSSRFINNYFKSRDGFMWLATRQGVNRFDGKNFKVFLNDEKHGFSNNCISFLQDDNENIWIQQLDIFSNKVNWQYLTF